jgi:nicotinamide-nucleotide amidase
MGPSRAQVVHNPVGTAPGLLFREEAKCFFVLPGVPYEMKAIVDGGIIPFLKTHVTGAHLRHLTLRTTGIAESVLARQIGPVDEFLGAATLAFLPSPTGVRLRVTIKGTSATHVDAEITRIEQILRSRAGKYIYGTGTEEIEEVLGRILTERKLTLAVAESCTGGLIADRITNVSGSSVYFERGIVAYSNRTKVQLLAVPDELIARHGAVSEEVAIAMAAGIRASAGTDLAISTTGIAGPSGGSEAKPVGLVWIGFADAHESIAVRHQFGGPRRVIKERASQAALDLLRKKLL